MNERLEVNVKNGINYDIVYESGFDALNDELKRLEFTGKKACIVTDSIVEPLYCEELKSVLESAGNTVSVFVFPSGEILLEHWFSKCGPQISNTSITRELG